MPFNASIVLPTGTPFNGSYFTRDLNGNGVIDSAGDVVDGGVITLRFPGAGSNVAANSQAFLGGVNGVIESAALDARFDTIMPAGWGMPGGDGSFVRSDRTLNGTKTLRNSRETGAYQFGIRYDQGAPRRTLFARYSYFFDNPNNISVGQLKQYRVCGKLVGGGIYDGDIANALLRRYADLAWTIQNHGDADDPEGGGENTAIITGSNSQSNLFHLSNVWVTVEVATTCNSATNVADGRLRWFARREDTGEIIGQNTHDNVLLWTHGQPHRYQVLQMYMGNGFDTTCKLYLDRDIYFSASDTTDAPKYILLGNASTYAACTRFTVCDFSTWTPVGDEADVAFKVNKGAHPSLAGLYGYAMAGINLPIHSSGVAL